MSLSVKRIVTSTAMALVAGPFFMVSSMAATDAVAAPSTQAVATDSTALSAAVVQAINASMGDQVKNVKVSSNAGAVTLSGWVTGPSQVSQARFIASKVPGATKVFSRLRAWAT